MKGMPMVTVTMTHFDNTTRAKIDACFDSVHVKLGRIPHVGELIVSTDKDGNGQVFEVFSVQHTANAYSLEDVAEIAIAFIGDIVTVNTNTRRRILERLGIAPD